VCLVVSRENIQFLVVGLQVAQVAPEKQSGPPLEIETYALYKHAVYAHNLFFPEWGSREIVWGREDLRMKIGKVRALPFVVLSTLAAAPVRAQQPADKHIQSTDQSGTTSQISAAASQASQQQTTHRFWDRTNDMWFAGVGAARGLDYASTLNLRRRGLDEILLTNSVVDNHPLFGGIEATATAASIGVSYLFHRTGHHRLERWTSIVHFSVAIGGAARNYALKTPHPR
jgi:hypothetical protein